MAARLDFNASVTLKHNGLLRFGTATWFEGDSLGLVGEGGLGVGENAELRVVLAGTPDTVRVDVEVAAVDEASSPQTSLYTVRIVKADFGDRDLLEQWVSAHCGLTREEDPQSSSVTRSAQTWAPSSGGTTPRPERGRTGITQALMSALDPDAAAQASDGPPPRLPPHEGPPDSPRPPASEETLFDPEVTWTEGAPRAQVTWLAPQSLIRDWRTYLCNAALPLSMAPPHPAPGTRLKLQLRLPDGQPLSARAEVKGCAGHTVLCAVELTPRVRDRLSQAARAAELADPD